MKNYLKIKILFTVLFFLLILQENYAQDFINKETSSKITVIENSSEKVSIIAYYQSSGRCMCEETEKFEIVKNVQGIFIHEVQGNPDYTLNLEYTNGKISKITVKNDQDYQCCMIKAGIYQPKLKKE